jgi:hypothetical protein
VIEAEMAEFGSMQIDGHRFLLRAIRRLTIAAVSASVVSVSHGYLPIELDHIDDEGRLLVNYELEELRIDSTMTLPVGIQFQPMEDRDSYLPTGWRIPILESRFKVGLPRTVEVMLPWGDIINLISEDREQPASYVNKYLGWTGELQSNNLALHYFDGTKLFFVDSRLEHLITPAGTVMQWLHSNAQIRVASPGNDLPYCVLDDSKGGDAAGPILRLRQGEYKIETAKAGEVRVRRGTVITFKALVDYSDSNIKILTNAGDPLNRSHLWWDDETGLINKKVTPDGKWHYSIRKEASSIDSDSWIVIERTDDTGNKESYSLDVSSGISETAYIFKFPSNYSYKITSYFNLKPGPEFLTITRIERAEYGNVTTIYESQYDEHGRLVKEVVDEYGNTKRYEYSPEGFMSREFFNDEILFTREKDADGEITDSMFADPETKVTLVYRPGAEMVRVIIETRDRSPETVEIIKHDIESMFPNFPLYENIN